MLANSQCSPDWWTYTRTNKSGTLVSANGTICGRMIGTNQVSEPIVFPLWISQHHPETSLPVCQSQTKHCKSKHYLSPDNSMTFLPLLLLTASLQRWTIRTQNCGDARRREGEGAASAFELCTLMATHKQEWSFSAVLSSLPVNTASVIGRFPVIVLHVAQCWHWHSWRQRTASQICGVCFCRSPSVAYRLWCEQVISHLLPSLIGKWCML